MQTGLAVIALAHPIAPDPSAIIASARAPGIELAIAPPSAMPFPPISRAT